MQWWDCGAYYAKVLQLIKDAHAEARRILSSNRTKLDVLASFLLEKETITGDEFMALLHAEQTREAADKQVNSMATTPEA